MRSAASARSPDSPRSPSSISALGIGATTADVGTLINSVPLRPLPLPAARAARQSKHGFTEESLGRVLGILLSSISRTFKHESRSLVVGRADIRPVARSARRESRSMWMAGDLRELFSVLGISSLVRTRLPLR